MKWDKLAAILAVVMPITALAADKGGDRPSFLPLGEVAAQSSWSGFYVGAHAGYGWGEWSGDFHWQDQSMGHGYDLTTENWLYGIQVGVNHQIGKMVLGVEADVTWGDMENSGQFQANDANDPGEYVEWGIKQRLERFGTVRLRAGYLPSQNFLMYATGGLAWAQTEASQVIHYTKAQPVYVNGVGSVEENHIGYTVGGGAEWALTPKISLKAEYLYLNFGEQNYHFVGKSGKNLDTFYADDRAPSDLDFHVVRGGLNFKLN